MAARARLSQARVPRFAPRRWPRIRGAADRRARARHAPASVGAQAQAGGRGREIARRVEFHLVVPRGADVEGSILRGTGGGAGLYEGC